MKALKHEVIPLKSEVERYKAGPSQKRLRDSPDPGANKKAKAPANKIATKGPSAHRKPNPKAKPKNPSTTPYIPYTNYTGIETLDRLILLDQIIAYQLEHQDDYFHLSTVDNICQRPRSVFSRNSDIDNSKLRKLLEKEQFNIRMGFRCKSCKTIYQSAWKCCPSCKYVETKKRHKKRQKSPQCFIGPPVKAIIKHIRDDLKKQRTLRCELEQAPLTTDPTSKKGRRNKLKEKQAIAHISTTPPDTWCPAVGNPLASTSCNAVEAIPYFHSLE